MPKENKQLSLDPKLLSNAIIELTISRRHVAIYPQDHSAVKRSLNRAYESVQKLLDIRPEITLAIAKDTLMIDNSCLDQKNPVYRKFALLLSDLSIAYITFIAGLTVEELYELNKWLSEKPADLSPESIQNQLKSYKLIHIKVGFIDYGFFDFEEGKVEQIEDKGHLWERYVYGLINENLQAGDVSEVIEKIPPDILAGLLNKGSADNLKEETYDKILTDYFRRPLERSFSSKDIKKLIDFINSLRPELKKQFLSSTMRVASRDIKIMENSLNEISVEEVIKFLNIFNEQTLSIPKAFKNLMNKFSKLNKERVESLFYGGGLVVDDFLLTPELTEFLSGEDFDTFVTDTYQKEIEKLLDFDPSHHVQEERKDINMALRDEILIRDHCETLLELILSDVLSEEDYNDVLITLKKLCKVFLEGGRYTEALSILEVLKRNFQDDIFKQLTSTTLEYLSSPEIISILVESLELLGKEFREEAMPLLDHYGERVIPALMDTICEIESTSVRRFFINLTIHFGEKVVPEAIKRIGSSKWFIKRNMLYILNECGGDEIIPYARQYCRHEHPKVLFEAIRGLLKTGDRYGVPIIRKHLRADSKEIVEQAITLSGAYRLKEVVPDLIDMLRKKERRRLDSYDKIHIIRVLGEIGDIHAVEALREFLSQKSILFKGTIEKLREEIYKTLKDYPYEKIKDLVEIGIKSKNEIIMKESWALKDKTKSV